MAKLKNPHDLSGEFVIQRMGGGIQLLSPNALKAEEPATLPSVTIAEIMQLPFNVYFMNSGSEIVSMNPITVATCGWRSLDNAIGKSVRDLWPDKYAKAALANDSDAMLSRQLKIVEEYAFHGNTDDVQALSFKFPWFNAEHELLGIFGCSLILNVDHGYSLASSIAMLTNTGLLSPAPAETTKPAAEKKFFSTREMDVLRHLVRAKTAKEIGILLGLSYRTVQHYIENAKHKLGVSSRSELIDKAVSYFE
jgi:DNA-binding CsgD family transcriptional regulator